MLEYLQEGDVVRVNCQSGELEVLVDAAELAGRTAAPEPLTPNTLGRGLFEKMREVVGDSTHGASFIGKSE